MAGPLFDVSLQANKFRKGSGDFDGGIKLELGLLEIPGAQSRFGEKKMSLRVARFLNERTLEKRSRRNRVMAFQGDDAEII